MRRYLDIHESRLIDTQVFRYLDVSTSRRIDVHTCGCIGIYECRRACTWAYGCLKTWMPRLRMSRHADVHTYGCPGMQMYMHLDVQACRCTYVWMSRSADVRTCMHLDVQACGLLGAPGGPRALNCKWELVLKLCVIASVINLLQRYCKCNKFIKGAYIAAPLFLLAIALTEYNLRANCDTSLNISAPWLYSSCTGTSRHTFSFWSNSFV